MKTAFYSGITFLILFEIAKVYFLMPFPGSQETSSIDLAYFLFQWKWIFRCFAGLLILIGFRKSWQHSRVVTLIGLILAAVVVFMTSFEMRPDRMFLQTENLIMAPDSHNVVPQDKLIIGIEHNGEAAAFPINYLAYHHLVNYTIGNKTVLVTYCSVCRSGKVYRPIVNDNNEKFRLVGMDHYNALLEDISTKSWWRQVNGAAVAGKLKGEALPEFPSLQTTLSEWLRLHPKSLIMQPEEMFRAEYDHLKDFETGLRGSRLTRRDTIAWEDKAWIAGVKIEEVSKAYDWNELVKARVINDVVNDQPIVIVIADDLHSLFAFERLFPQQIMSLHRDTLTDGINKYNLLGKPYNSTTISLLPIDVYQEYWHSWKTFHPNTLRYQN